jgi:hypothetical protein
LNPQAIITRKIYTINLQITLASQKELITRQRRSTPACKDSLKEESPAPAPAPALTPALDPFLPASKFPLIMEKT